MRDEFRRGASLTSRDASTLPSGQRASRRSLDTRTCAVSVYRASTAQASQRQKRKRNESVASVDARVRRGARYRTAIAAPGQAIALLAGDCRTQQAGQAEPRLRTWCAETRGQTDRRPPTMPPLPGGAPPSDLGGNATTGHRSTSAGNSARHATHRITLRSDGEAENRAIKRLRFMRGADRMLRAVIVVVIDPAPRRESALASDLHAPPRVHFLNRGSYLCSAAPVPKSPARRIPTIYHNSSVPGEYAIARPFGRRTGPIPNCAYTLVGSASRAAVHRDGAAHGCRTPRFNAVGSAACIARAIRPSPARVSRGETSTGCPPPG